MRPSRTAASPAPWRQDGGLMASSGVEAAVTLLDGGTLENNLIIADSVWIDSSNVADYE